MIDLDAIRKSIEAHDHDGICLSMAACCEVGSGEIAEQLLAEVERLLADAAPCPHGYYGPAQVCWMCK